LFKLNEKNRLLIYYCFIFHIIIKQEKGKTKFNVPVYLGVTKESVIKLDVETKEIIKKWPLKQLRRWAATPTRFILI